MEVFRNLSSKITNASNKLIIITVLLALVFGFLIYLFNYLGGFKIFNSFRIYKDSINYLNSLDGKNMEYERGIFFATKLGNNVHGGILVAAWEKGLWMLGDTGLKYYSAGETLDRNNKPVRGIKTVLYYVNGGCSEALTELNSRREQNIPAAAPFKSRFFEDILSNPYIELHLHNYRWRSRIMPGNYIQVKTKGNSNILEYASVVAEFAGPSNWVICNVGPLAK